MARKKKGRAVHGDLIEVAMSSGHTVLIRRPSIGVARMVSQKAAELHPDPEPVSTELKAVTGQAWLVAVDEDSPEYVQAVEAARAARMEYLLEYVFEKRLQVRGYEDDEGRQKLIDSYAADRAEALEWGSVPDDMAELDDWQFTLRTFVVADQGDYSTLMLASLKALDSDDLSEDEVRRRMSYFRG